MFHVEHDWGISGPVTAADVLKILGQAGLHVLTAQAEMLAQHANAVLWANERFNLTAITEPQGVLERHILDSALAVQPLQEAPPGIAVDIGTGAGYPGLVLSILTGRRFRLLDSTRKKAEFLAAVCARIGALSAEAVWERAESHARRHGREYAAVTARGVGELPTLVELAAPLLADEGRLIAYKGAPDPSEVSRGDAAARLCGMVRVSIAEMALPGGVRRALVVYERTAEPSVRLPRREGLAAKRPLG